MLRRRRALVFALVVTASLLAVACAGRAAPVATGTPAAAASPTPYALPASTPAYSGTVETVTGLSIAPATTTVSATQALPALPASTLPAWDGHSVVLYNLRTGAATNLGDGALGFGDPFSAASTRLTWQVGPNAGSSQITNSQVWVLDLATMHRRSYGDAAAATFGPGGTLRLATLAAGRLSQRAISLATGKAVAPGPALDAARIHYPQGFVVERGAASKQAPLLYVQRLVPDGGGPALQFDASQVVPLPGRSAVLAVLRNTSGTANVYRIDVGSTHATFIATVHAVPRTMPPLVALPDGTVAIGDRASCDDPAGRVLLYDSAAGTLRALTTRYAPSAVGVPGLGIDGNLGAARAVLDPSTLTYHDVLPAPGFFSPDGRWAVVGPSVAVSTDGCASTGG